MSKLFAPVPDARASFENRTPRAQPANDDAAAAAERREPQLGSPADAADLDMRDLVETFERNYAELAPPLDRPQQNLADDFFADIPDLFEAGPQRPRPATPSLTLAK